MEVDVRFARDIISVTIDRYCLLLSFTVNVILSLDIFLSIQFKSNKFDWRGNFWFFTSVLFHCEGKKCSVFFRQSILMLFGYMVGFDDVCSAI